MPENESELADDFYTFLKTFYSVFDVYRDYELYITGESYAGMYVPSIAHKVHKEELKKKKKHRDGDSEKGDDHTSIKLAGIAIGNGLMDARLQGEIRIDYAYYHGMIDTYTRDTLHSIWHECVRHGNDRSSKVELPPPFHAFNIPDDCGMLAAISIASGKDAWPDRPSGPVSTKIVLTDDGRNLAGYHGLIV